MSTCNVMTIGQTGSGKSRFCKAFAEHHGGKGESFVDSDSCESHTYQPVSVKVGNFTITDTPGLMDSKGVEYDEKNIVKIVNKACEFKEIHGIVLVMNDSNARFDSSMQNAIKLLVDSFGPPSTSHLGIAFSKATRNREQCSESVQEIKRLIELRTGVTMPDIPFWQYDACPEKTAAVFEHQFKIKISPDALADRKKTLSLEMEAVAKWARSKSALSTVDFSYGEYADRKRAREAKEKAEIERKRAQEAKERAELEQKKAQDAKQKAELERRRVQEAETKAQQERERKREAERRAQEEEKIRVHNAKVVQSSIEEQTILISSVTVPLFRQVRHKKKHRFLGIRVGSDVWYTNEHYADRIVKTMGLQTREIKKYGSGAVTYGPWTTTKTWEES